MWVTFGSTALFVLLWGAGAIFAKWGLQHASPFAFQLLRAGIAFVLLSIMGISRGTWLPRRGTRARVAGTGLLLLGSYQICYLLALDLGITPGVLATLLGVQPILTLLLFERRVSIPRLAGLGLAMGGVFLVVYHSVALARFSMAGMLAALAALASMTVGAILQKGITQTPMVVLPLQYGVSLLLCVVFIPFKPMVVDFTPGFLVALAYMGVIISVGATLLLYRLIQAGNLVKVTSLFYLVPVVTALLDYLVLGNRLAPLSVLGMAAILLGLMLVFREAAPAVVAPRSEV
ncbi:MAG TPA: DMT family transporter [Polyangiaceae bacterium]|nr:DMT family transporter [Polyangiaceae bacterium]